MLLDMMWPLLAACAVIAVSLAGVIFSAGRLGALMQRNLTYLATFSGGVFLVVVYHLLNETLHESASLALAAGAILFGAALMQALHHLLPDLHHHHTTEHDHTHSLIDGRRVLISDAFHNIGDGVMLVAAFSTSWMIGITAAIGIVIHELVQEVSEYFVLRESGYDNWQALSRNFASSSTILLGVVIAAFLGSAEQIAVLFAGVAAGGFLTILIQDLLPHAAESIRARGGASTHVIALLLGIALMLGVQYSFGHEEAAVSNDNTRSTIMLA